MPEETSPERNHPESTNTSSDISGTASGSRKKNKKQEEEQGWTTNPSGFLRCFSSDYLSLVLDDLWVFTAQIGFRETGFTIHLTSTITGSCIFVQIFLEPLHVFELFCERALALISYKLENEICKHNIPFKYVASHDNLTNPIHNVAQANIHQHSSTLHSTTNIPTLSPPDFFVATTPALQHVADRNGARQTLEGPTSAQVRFYKATAP